MGGIVKSIGKSVKKIGKGLSKAIKKIAPVLILAAAVWAGVSVLGAHGAGTLGSGSIFSAGNFTAGLRTIGKGVGNFFMPGTFGGEWQEQVVMGAPGPGTPMNTKRVYVQQAGNKNMTTADALMYMTKMNMFATGAKAVAGMLAPTEAELAEEKAEKKHQRLVKQIQETKGDRPPIQDPFSQFDIGQLSEPSMGRSSTRNFMSSAPRVAGSQPPSAYMGQGSSPFNLSSPGMITQGSQKRYT